MDDKKLIVGSEMIRARAYPLMQEAVEAGVALGLNRAHKHDENPSRDYISACIEEAVMHQINERFEFPVE